MVHCGSRGEYGVEAALATCTSRYLRRILEVSGARVIVLVGRISARAFESEVDVRLEEGFWGRGCPGSCRNLKVAVPRSMPALR